MSRKTAGRAEGEMKTTLRAGSELMVFLGEHEVPSAENGEKAGGSAEGERRRGADPGLERTGATFLADDP